MGNAAIGLGAIRAGVGVVSGYPGTPSTEVLETIAKARPGDVYVEWSVNEKVALEVAAGAAYTGKRALVTMKQVGLNVASDPLMSLAYIGVKGGMVVLVADDPGPISSQTEQDTRTFAQYSKLPVFDPATPEEAYYMIGEAFDYSEKYGTPVLFRPTTRVCHACAVIDVEEGRREIPAGHFEKDPRWVIFPKLSLQAHARIEARNPEIARDFSAYSRNAAETYGAGGAQAKRRDGVFDVEGLRPHDVARHEAAVEEHGEEQEERDERPAGQIAPGERVGEQRGDGEVRDGARHGDERGQDVAAHDTRRIHEQVLVSGEIDLLGEKAVAVAHQRVFLRD